MPKRSGGSDGGEGGGGGGEERTFQVDAVNLDQDISSQVSVALAAPPEIRPPQAPLLQRAVSLTGSSSSSSSGRGGNGATGLEALLGTMSKLSPTAVMITVPKLLAQGGTCGRYPFTPRPFRSGGTFS